VPCSRLDYKTEPVGPALEPVVEPDPGAADGSGEGWPYFEDDILQLVAKDAAVGILKPVVVPSVCDGDLCRRDSRA